VRPEERKRWTERDLRRLQADDDKIVAALFSVIYNFLALSESVLCAIRSCLFQVERARK